MELQFLGTAASEGWPALFCRCSRCEQARALGGKNIRTRSQSMIDRKLMIDFPPDTYYHMLQYGVALNQIEHVIITHSHEDHLYPKEFINKLPPFAHGETDDTMPLLHIYGNSEVIRLCKEALDVIEGWQRYVKLHEVLPFEPFEAGNYRVTALKAEHMAEEEETALCYLIEQGENRLLYAHDTGLPPPETLEYLKGKYLNCASLDCTCGLLETDGRGHMGLVQDIWVKNWLCENGAADENTIFICNHFSHNGLAVYDKMEKEAQKQGFIASYDGMTVKF